MLIRNLACQNCAQRYANDSGYCHFPWNEESRSVDQDRICWDQVERCVKRWYAHDSGYYHFLWNEESRSVDEDHICWGQVESCVKWRHAHVSEYCHFYWWSEESRLVDQVDCLCSGHVKRSQFTWMSDSESTHIKHAGVKRSYVIRAKRRTLLESHVLILRSAFLLWAKDKECDQGCYKANGGKSSGY